MSSASSLFGGNSDGAARMEEWLQEMCRGCKKDRGRGPSGGMGGMSCPLPARAYTDPDAAMPEWSETAGRPDQLAALGPGPWPVWTSYTSRKRRRDAGRPRGTSGMEPMFILGDKS